MKITAAMTDIQCLYGKYLFEYALFPRALRVCSRVDKSIILSLFFLNVIAVGKTMYWHCVCLLFFKFYFRSF